MPKIIHGGKPSSDSGTHGSQVPAMTPVHGWRTAVDRLYSWEEW